MANSHSAARQSSFYPGRNVFTWVKLGAKKNEQFFYPAGKKMGIAQVKPGTIKNEPNGYGLKHKMLVLLVS